MGATNSITFPLLTGYWELEVDDVKWGSDGNFHPLTILGDYQYLIDTFYAPISDDFSMQNIDTQNDHRIRLIPKMSANYTAPTDNQTFIEHEDGSLTFCLVHAENE